MSAFVVKFDTDNAAFGEGNFAVEVARILRDIATRVQQGDYRGNIRDVNGNRVGNYMVEE